MKLIVPDLLFDGRSELLVPRGAVLVDGTRIAGVGTEGDLGAPSVERIPVRGALLPGLIDCHTHVCLSAGPDPGGDVLREATGHVAARAVRALRRLLRKGITSIRDLGGPHGIDTGLAEAVRCGLVPGPRMIAAGRALCMTGGHGHFLAMEVDGADAARRAARLQLKAGAGVVKLIATGGIMTEGVEPGAAQLTEHEMRAAVEEAHKASRRVAAHAQGNQGIRDAVAAGVDTIEHGFYLEERAIAAMKERNVALVPTFTAAKRIAEGAARGVPRFMVEKARRVREDHLTSFRAAVEAGVRVAAGTDAGTPFNEHGDLATEVFCMHEAGLGPMDSIRAATGWAAETIGRSDVGILEGGRFADFLVVGGNPLEDLHVLERPAQVWQGGEPVSLSER